MIPRCVVSITIDNDAPVLVGYASPKSALEDYLSKYGEVLLGGRVDHRVIEQSFGGLTLAYALYRDPFFMTWNFLQVARESDGDLDPEFLRTCGQGVAVEFSPPGFFRNGIVALGNATGRGAPKTNVARSSIEKTPESIELARNIYAAYTTQIANEMRRLVDKEEFSLSRAMSEITFLALPITRAPDDLISPALMDDAMADLPLFLLEDTSSRQAVSSKQLEAIGQFWSVIAPIEWSIEHLIGDMPVPITARQLYSMAGDRLERLPDGPIVVNINNATLAENMIDRKFEISEMRAFEKDRRIDLRWNVKAQTPVWIDADEISGKVNRASIHAWHSITTFFRGQSRRGYSFMLNMYLPIGRVELSGLTQYTAVEVFGRLYLLPGDPIVEFLRPLSTSASMDELTRCVIYLYILRSRTTDKFGLFDTDKMGRQLAAANLEEYVPDWKAFVDVLAAVPARKFNPFAWSRHIEATDE